MSSEDTYQHISHFQELLNIDKKIGDMNVQLDKVFEEVNKLARMGIELNKHSIDYRRLWSQQNIVKYQQLLEKCTKIDMTLENVHK